MEGRWSPTVGNGVDVTLPIVVMVTTDSRRWGARKMKWKRKKGKKKKKRIDEGKNKKRGEGVWS